MRNAYAVKRDPRLSWGGLQHPASDLSPARCMSPNALPAATGAVCTKAARELVICAAPGSPVALNGCIEATPASTSSGELAADKPARLAAASARRLQHTLESVRLEQADGAHISAGL